MNHKQLAKQLMEFFSLAPRTQRNSPVWPILKSGLSDQGIRLVGRARGAPFRSTDTRRAKRTGIGEGSECKTHGNRDAGEPIRRDSPLPRQNATPDGAFDRCKHTSQDDELDALRWNEHDEASHAFHVERKEWLPVEVVMGKPGVRIDGRLVFLAGRSWNDDLEAYE